MMQVRRIVVRIVVLSVLAATARSVPAGTCVARFGDRQAAVESLASRLRDGCGCCPERGRRRCATVVIRAAIANDEITRACAKVAKRGFAVYCRRNQQASCVPTGGCLDTIAATCTGQSCLLGGTDCLSVDARCSSACRGEGSELEWRATCGDPVCGTHREHPGVPACTATQTRGTSCVPPGATCDPGSDCNELLVCTTDDPTHGGVCPISRRAFKDDVRYLDDAERRRLHDELMEFHLATWRYKDLPGDRRHLGFMIDDVEPTAATERDHVDLYGYTSMAVAALQTQARQIDALEREVAALRAALSRRRPPAQLRSQRSSISSRSPSAARKVAINAGSAPASSRMSSDATSNQ
jgi:hypothetical protein